MENKPTIKTNEGLAELKHVLKNNESGYFGDSLIANKEMLTRPVCQKLVTYFFNKYPEVVEEMKQNQDNEEFLKNIENICILYYSKYKRCGKIKIFPHPNRRFLCNTKIIIIYWA